jgi:hypothetical protein
MRRHQLIPLNVRFLGATMRRLSLYNAPGAEGAGEGAGAGSGGAAGGEPAKTYTEADIQALKAKNAELIGKNKTLAERAKVLGERTPEDVLADLDFAAKAKEEKARAEGNFETLKQQLIQQHTTEREKLTGRTKKVEGKLFDVLAKREAEAAITAAGGNAKILLPHVLPFLKVIEHDDDFAAQVVDAKGNPRIADGQATPMTIAQLVEQFKADETFGGAFAASGASGSGARNEGAGRGGNAVVLIPKDATPQEYRRMKDDAVKRGIPYAIAS